MDIESVRAYCLSFPHATEKVQWGADLVFKIGGKMFAVISLEPSSDHCMSFKATPEKFAERDRLWATGDPDYYALSDALQHLGNVAFRAPVPAYKHSAAYFLHLTGRIPSNRTHPKSAPRPAWEAEMMKDCALRLGLLQG